MPLRGDALSQWPGPAIGCQSGEDASETRQHGVSAPDGLTLYVHSPLKAAGLLLGTYVLSFGLRVIRSHRY